MTDADDLRWMQAALAIGERGRGPTWPNPNVGCVIVADGVVVGRGWTQPGGRPHAEAMALEQAGLKSRGATLYSTLEPCAHVSTRGRACANLIVEAGVARVVAALRDPDPRTDGQGLAILDEAGVLVTPDVGATSAARSMSGFLMKRTAGRPFVTLKLALSIDGCIAAADGTSQWITGPHSRAHAHLERARSDAILVGRGTYDADKPRLDVRLPGLKHRAPRRVLLSTTPPPDGWGGITAIDDIAGLAADWLLVEGGAKVATALVAADLVDRLMIYRAPITLGGTHAMHDVGLGKLAESHGRWLLFDRRALGDDQLEIYDRIRN